LNQRELTLTTFLVLSVPVVAQQPARGSLAVGGIAVQLGMMEDDALKRFGSVYEVRNISDQAGQWLILRRGGPPFEVLGTLGFTNRRLVFASRQWSSANSQDANTFANGIVDALGASEGDACVIRLASKEPLRQVVLTCNGRELTISAGSKELAASMSETIKALR